eukprot:1798350-Pleurochrysis_carterae.AAC.2
MHPIGKTEQHEAARSDTLQAARALHNALRYSSGSAAQRYPGTLARNRRSFLMETELATKHHCVFTRGSSAHAQSCLVCTRGRVQLQDLAQPSERTSSSKRIGQTV